VGSSGGCCWQAPAAHPGQRGGAADAVATPAHGWRYSGRSGSPVDACAPSPGARRQRRGRPIRNLDSWTIGYLWRARTDQWTPPPTQQLQPQLERHIWPTRERRNSPWGLSFLPEPGAGPRFGGATAAPMKPRGAPAAPRGPCNPLCRIPRRAPPPPPDAAALRAAAGARRAASCSRCGTSRGNRAAGPGHACRRRRPAMPRARARPAGRGPTTGRGAAAGWAAGGGGAAAVPAGPAVGSAPAAVDNGTGDLSLCHWSAASIHPGPDRARRVPVHRRVHGLAVTPPTPPPSPPPASFATRTLVPSLLSPPPPPPPP